MDDGGSRLSWIFAVVLLVVLAMVFAVMETAFASVSRSRIRSLADKGDSRAKTANEIIGNFEQAITAILIGTNIVHIAAASIVTVNVTKIWGLSAVTASTFIMTLVVFFFGEMLPKSIARKYSERLSLMTAGLLSFIMFVFKPASFLLSVIGKAAASLTRGDAEVSVTEDELYDIIEDMTEQGTLDEEQGELISSALQFQDTEVQSVLTSRVDLAAIDVDMDQEEILDIIKKCNHSRLPVYEGTIDHIIGILQIRKYIKAYLADREKPVDLRSLLDAPYYVYQSAKIDDVLTTMSREKLNLAVVIDPYGGTKGVITVEDILEELVGEIWDEDDRAVETVTRLPDGTWSVDADDLVTDILDQLEIPYTEEQEAELENKLMRELALEAFTEIPKEGDTFPFLNTTIMIQIMKGNRISRLRVKIHEDSEGGKAA